MSYAIEELSPGSLVFEDIVLNFKELVRPTGNSQLVPFYNFDILNKNLNNTKVGHINFRVGETNHVRLYAGFIGYEILERYRGNNYSYKACKAIEPFVKNYYESVIITAEVENASSIKVIEKLGAKKLNIVKVPKDDPSFLGGAREKVRYEWTL